MFKINAMLKKDNEKKRRIFDFKKASSFWENELFGTDSKQRNNRNY
jgi:hypothetical protein